MRLPSRRAAAVFALMLALHALVGWLLVAASSRSPAPPGVLRLTAFLVPGAFAPPAVKPSDRQRDEPPTRVQGARSVVPSAAAFAPLALPEPGALAGANVAAAAADPAASEPQVGPLNLSLPRTRDHRRGASGTQLGEGLEDSGATSSGGFGARLARALGSDRTLVEVPLNGDSVRLRQGSDCVVVSRSRESQLDPFNQSVNPSARGVTPCR